MTGRILYDQVREGVHLLTLLKTERKYFCTLVSKHLLIPQPIIIWDDAGSQWYVVPGMASFSTSQLENSQAISNVDDSTTQSLLYSQSIAIQIMQEGP